MARIITGAWSGGKTRPMAESSSAMISKLRLSMSPGFTCCNWVFTINPPPAIDPSSDR